MGNADGETEPAGDNDDAAVADQKALAHKKKTTFPSTPIFYIKFHSFFIIQIFKFFSLGQYFPLFWLNVFLGICY